MDDAFQRLLDDRQIAKFVVIGRLGVGGIRISFLVDQTIVLLHTLI